MSAGRSASCTSATANSPSTPCSEHFLPYGVPRAHLSVQILFGYAGQKYVKPGLGLLSERNFHLPRLNGERHTQLRAHFNA